METPISLTVLNILPTEGGNILITRSLAPDLVADGLSVALQVKAVVKTATL
jgi:hypothetical protein